MHAAVPFRMLIFDKKWNVEYSAFNGFFDKLTQEDFSDHKILCGKLDRWTRIVSHRTVSFVLNETAAYRIHSLNEVWSEMLCLILSIPFNLVWTMRRTDFFPYFFSLLSWKKRGGDYTPIIMNSYIKSLRNTLHTRMVELTT